jgi:hypothetical protein
VGSISTGKYQSVTFNGVGSRARRLDKAARSAIPLRASATLNEPARPRMASETWRKREKITVSPFCPARSDQARNGKLSLKIVAHCWYRLTILGLRTLTSAQNGHVGRLRGPSE